MKTRLFITALIILLLSILGGCGNKEVKNEELKLGKYITEDGFAWVVLQDDNKFVFNRHIATSYDPTGSFSIKDEELVLYVTDDEKYVFEVKDSQLIFKSGEGAESLVDIGTVFSYVLNDDNSIT